MLKRIAVVIGTRPEAIKMAPVILALREIQNFEVTVINSGQHRDLLNGVLEVFGLTADMHLEVMVAGQTLPQLNAKSLLEIEKGLSTQRFDLVLVHGDTTTAMAAALSAFYMRIPVAHVEAGLRTGVLSAPFPEELNRQLIARVASLNFSTSDLSASNLIREGLAPESIEVTGNTVVDSVAFVFNRYLANPSWLKWRAESLADLMPEFDGGRPKLLVTLHRRENSGEGFEGVLSGVRRIIEQNPELQVVFPVHPNPIIRSRASQLLGGIQGVVLCEPLGYLDFLFLMATSSLIVSDSGGVQEEGVTLGTPVLIARNQTERPEGLRSGLLELVGSDPEKIFSRSKEILRQFSREELTLNLETNPFGDGRASARIASSIENYLKPQT